MRKSERVLIFILRLIGVTGLFALPAMFLPFAWMDAIHAYLGMGSLPDRPIVAYLARSLSMFYAAFSVITLYISFDVRKHVTLVGLWATLFLVMGCLLLAMDLWVGMPFLWTVCEGPPTIVVGTTVLWLWGRVARESESAHQAE